VVESFLTDSVPEEVFVASTYRDIIDFVAEPARARASLHLSQEVVRIESGASSNGELSKVLVQTADSVVRLFDEVVVTAPLGWLKCNKEKFQPPLYPRLAQAIDHISYGNLEKVFIAFPMAFWDGPNGSDPFPPETAFLTPSYAPSTNPHGWTLEMLSNTALPGSYRHPTLLFWMYGANSKSITHSIATLSPSSPEYYKVLDKFFEPYYSRLPYYDSSSPKCRPSGYLSSAWSQDKFAGYGSYSNYQVGLEDGVSDIEVMREGMPGRQIWLAGEHTAPLEITATTFGAYRSGEAVAARIASCYGIEPEPLSNDP
jgi:Flavin containing amine oxidoreductase